MTVEAWRSNLFTPRPGITTEMALAVLGSWVITAAVPVGFVVIEDHGWMRFAGPVREYFSILFQPTGIALIGALLLGASTRRPYALQLGRLICGHALIWMLEWAIVAQSLDVAFGANASGLSDVVPLFMAPAAICGATFGALSLLTLPIPASPLLGTTLRAALASIPVILALIAIAAKEFQPLDLQTLEFISVIAAVLMILSAVSAAATQLVAPRMSEPSLTTPSDRS